METNQVGGHEAHAFTLLIYPFVHACAAPERAQRLRTLSARWEHWWRRLQRAPAATDAAPGLPLCATPAPVAEPLRQLLDDAYFFLPSLRTLLFPETVHMLDGAHAQHLVQAQALLQHDLSALAHSLHADGMLRLTLSAAALAPLRDLSLVETLGAEDAERTPFCAHLDIEWIDVALFPPDIGFLLVKLRVREPVLSIDGLSELYYHVRQVLPAALGWRLPTWQFAGADAAMVESHRLLDFLLEGVVAPSDALSPDLATFLRTTTPAQLYTHSAQGQGFGAIFHLYSYICLEQGIDTQPPTATVDGHRLFASPVQQALYELATCTSTSNTDYVPHPHYVGRLLDQGHIALWGNWEGLTLHDSAVFLVTQPTGFTRNALAHNVESDYLHLHLLTLYQKMRLNVLSGQLLRQRYARSRVPRLRRAQRRATALLGQPCRAHHNVHDARTLWEGFVMFRNHYWLAEVTLKPQGMVLYRRFQSGLGTEHLYSAVSEQVRELRQFYEEQAQRRIGNLLAFITFVGVPGTLLFTIYSGIGIVNGTPAQWIQFVRVGILLYVAMAVAYGVWRMLGNET